MKKGKPLQRTTRLQTTKPLSRGKPLQQGSSTLKQGGAPLKRSGGGMQRSRQWKPAPPKMTPQERRTRKLVRKRSDGFCEKCGTPGATDMAHRISRGVGGGWEAANILHLCRSCHAYHHQNPTIAYDGGWHLRSTSSPTRTPVWLYNSGDTALATLNNDGTITWTNSAEGTT